MSSLSLIATDSTSLFHAYTVLSSAKFQTWEDFIAKMKSLTKILKNSGPRTEPCGTPDTISCHSLNVWETIQPIPFGRVQSPLGPRASHVTLRIVSYARLQASIKDLCHHTCDESVRVIIKVKL